MQRYEYRVMHESEFRAGRDIIGTESALNTLGNDGWELVSASTVGVYILKRKVGNTPMEDAILAAFAGIERSLQAVIGLMGKFASSSPAGTGKAKK